MYIHVHIYMDVYTYIHTYIVYAAGIMEYVCIRRFQPLQNVDSAQTFKGFLVSSSALGKSM